MAARQNKNQPRPTNHNSIARAVFAAAEAIGITDRKLLEELTGQVIQRLESRPALPGMESLVPRQENKQPPSASQIEVAVKEILAEQNKITEPLAPEIKAEAKTEALDIKMVEKPEPKAEAKVKPGVQLTQNALTVLEKRYLKKDSQGQVIETPDEMFRRVAKHIASAELIYNTEADVSDWEEKFYQLMSSLDLDERRPRIGAALGLFRYTC
jgi:ribonucleoside-diphosphate reductase alpha chain